MAKIMISFQCDTNEEATAILEAVAALGKEPHACSKRYVEPEEIKDVPAERKNISPGPSSITKIGSNTLEQILGMVQDGHQPPRPKYDEHLKLLWSRSKVKYDGENYYL